MISCRRMCHINWLMNTYMQHPESKFSRWNWVPFGNAIFNTQNVSIYLFDSFSRQSVFASYCELHLILACDILEWQAWWALLLIMTTTITASYNLVGIDPTDCISNVRVEIFHFNPVNLIRQDWWRLSDVCHFIATRSRWVEINYKAHFLILTLFLSTCAQFYPLFPWKTFHGWSNGISY